MQEQQASLVAAASLAIAMALVMAGTIWRADPAPPPGCVIGCEATPARATAPGPSWEDRLHRFARQVDRGFQQMAGLPRGY